MPLTQKNRCQLFGSVNLAVANFNAESLMAIAASHNRGAYCWCWACRYLCCHIRCEQRELAQRY